MQFIVCHLYLLKLFLFKNRGQTENNRTIDLNPIIPTITLNVNGQDPAMCCVEEVYFKYTDNWGWGERYAIETLSNESLWCQDYPGLKTDIYNAKNVNSIKRTILNVN